MYIHKHIYIHTVIYDGTSGRLKIHLEVSCAHTHIQFMYLYILAILPLQNIASIYSMSDNNENEIIQLIFHILSIF